MKNRRIIWRRRLLRAALCVLLGAVTTVGVAWGIACGFRGATARREDWLLYGNKQYWDVDFQAGAGWSVLYLGYHGGFPRRGPVAARSERSIGPEPRPLREAADATVELLPLDRLDTSPFGKALDASSMATLRSNRCIDGSSHCFAYGLPFRSLRMIDEAQAHNVDEAHDSYPLQALFKESTGGVHWNGERLPVAPISRGFVLDTLFYAAPWWALLASPGLVKRWRRKRRGACLTCGYDLRGLGGGVTCPECGT